MAFLIGIWAMAAAYTPHQIRSLYDAGSTSCWSHHLLYNLTGTFDLPQFSSAANCVASLRTPGTLLFLSFFIAFASKSLLPAAHVAARRARRSAHAGSVILAGFSSNGTYGMMRFCLPLFPGMSRKAAPYIAVFAIIALSTARSSLSFSQISKSSSYSSVTTSACRSSIFTFGVIACRRYLPDARARHLHRSALPPLRMLYDRRHTYEISEYGGLATPSRAFRLLPLRHALIARLAILNASSAST